MREFDSDLITKVIPIEGIESKAVELDADDNETPASKAWEIYQRVRARQYAEELRRRGRING